MRILILNTCSTLNRGDAAIVLGQICLLRKLYPGARVALTSKTPALDRAFYDPLDVEVLSPLTPALSSYRGTGRKLSEGARALACRGGERRRLIQAVRRSDLVLSCGGGYFYSYRSVLPGTTFWQNVLHAYLATALRKPLIFLPQSFGPFANYLAQRSIRHLLERRSVLHVFAREEISNCLLRQMLGEAMQAKVTLCPDMAFYLAEGECSSTLQNEAQNRARPTLVMNLREWTFPEAEDPASRRSKREEYLEVMLAVAHHFVHRYRGEVVLVPQALGPDPSEDDRGVCQEFHQRLSSRISTVEAVHYREPETSSLTEYLGLLSKATILVGTRLHSCILAFLSGVPAVSVGYQYKSQGTLDLLGLGSLNADIYDLSVQKLLSLIDMTLDRRYDLCEEIRLRVHQACQQIDDRVGDLIRKTAGQGGS
jgi:colanic acid/amylovoran biosynthesis protein